jgi:hypothetical protein
LISSKQAGHYLVPAVPFFAIAAAASVGPTILPAARRLNPRTIRALTAVIVIAAGVAAWLPGVGRDRRRMQEIELLARSVPVGATIGICPEANGDWGLHAWFERRFHVSLDAAGGTRRDWFLATPQAPRICLPASCRPVAGQPGGLVLTRCSSADSR